MERLIPVKAEPDILPAYRKTPIETLLAHQNLNRPHGVHDKAELLIGMCMDNHKHLGGPENFAYILRSGGGNLRYSEFKGSYAVASRGLSAIPLPAHTNRGRVNRMAKRGRALAGLVDRAGSDPAW